MKKIVFGITGLNLGGAERVLVDIVNELCLKYDITIFTLYGNGEFESQVSKKVKIESIYNCSYNELSSFNKKIISFKMVNKFLRKRIYNKFIKGKYDVEIAFLEGPITWIFAVNSEARKIAWVHNDIEDVFGNDKKAMMKQKINKSVYNDYDRLIFVSKDNLEKFENFFLDNNVSKQVIYNYLDCDLVLKKANKDKVTEIKSDIVSFVQVSRIVSQKALFRLLDVHKKLIEDGYKHVIYIVGDGPLKHDLDEKIEEYNLKDSFVLLGKKENPYPYIKKANYFMLTSFYEGYPMVLLEGKALNKYILITDSAARETLIDYDDKVIVSNDFDGIYKGIKDIILNKPKCSNKVKYDNKEILEQIIKVIEGDV